MVPGITEALEKISAATQKVAINPETQAAGVSHLTHTKKTFMIPQEPRVRPKELFFCPKELFFLS